MISTSALACLLLLGSQGGAGGVEAAERGAQLSGALEEARELLEAAQAASPAQRPEILGRSISLLVEAPQGEGHGPFADLLEEIGFYAASVGIPDRARAAMETALSLREANLPEGDLRIATSKLALAQVLQVQGELDRAIELLKAVLEVFELELPPDHRNLNVVRNNLALTLRMAGDLEGALALQEQVLEAYLASSGPDHEDVAAARWNLATTLHSLGETARARDLLLQALDHFADRLPDGDPTLLTLRQNLAGTLLDLGQLERGRDLLTEVVGAYAEHVDPRHPGLLAARRSLARAMHDLGDLKGALALQREVVTVYEEIRPPDDFDLAAARMSLGGTLWSLGDLGGARPLLEQALATYERLDPRHPWVSRAKMNLAVARRSQGDQEGGLHILEEVVRDLEGQRPPDDPLLASARKNLASALVEDGDLARAVELQEAALSVLEARLPSQHPELARTRMSLANTLFVVGELERSEDLLRRTLADVAIALPADHPTLSAVQYVLGNVKMATGAVDEARTLFERALAARLAFFPEHHAEIGWGRLRLAEALAETDDRGELPALLSVIAEGVLARLSAQLDLSAREVAEVAERESGTIAAVLSFPESRTSPALARQCFQMVETHRALAAACFVHPELERDPEWTALRAEAAVLRRRIGDLVADSAAAIEASAPREELGRVVLERDRVEARIRELVLDRGFAPPTVTAPQVAATLVPEELAVGYRMYERSDDEALVPVLLANVVASDGTVERVELGTRDALAVQIRAWREALETRASGARGLGPEDEGAADEAALAAAGEELRRMLIDPILTLDEAATALRVCTDDLVHLVPLDALPMDATSCVGDRVRIRVVTSFAGRAGSKEPPPEPPPGTGAQPFVVLGGIDYDATGVSPGSPPAPSSKRGSETISAQGTAMTRGATRGFPYLPGTEVEARVVGELFRFSHDREPLLLVGGEATKESLVEAVRGARWLHLATHGYFAGELGVRSPSRLERLGLRSEGDWRFLAPMTLCGLTLAGANHGRDGLGRVPGIVTAEELAGLDLAGCEVAVLSACDTSLGLGRAGQGLQSLQAALHAAGAQNVIASLWKADDRWTQTLMQELYRRLWIEGDDVENALWNAKRALRNAGAEPADWAGWILTSAHR